jgi:UDP-glucose 6-dehydrogenase
MKIGIIGRGTVGDAVYNGIAQQGHDVAFFDPRYPESRQEHVLDADCVFLCVPTDSNQNGD